MQIENSTVIYYHGTKADLPIGALLTSGFPSNYQPEVLMNHIYFSATLGPACLAAELARGVGQPRVYIVEPLGAFEDDPNVTDKKFPGNPTQSYRSKEPIKIIGEIKEWPRMDEVELQKWKTAISNIKGEIIN